jgi:hypothetical protein
MASRFFDCRRAIGRCGILVPKKFPLNLAEKIRAVRAPHPKACEILAVEVIEVVLKPLGERGVALLK